MKYSALDRRRMTASLGALATLALLSSCSLLASRPATPLRTYALDNAATGAAPASPSGNKRLVLLVDMPRAMPGCNSNHMVYIRNPMQPQSYANSVWMDTPANMLAPLLQTRLAQSGDFRAVLLSPSAAKADLRLDSTIISLRQNFLNQPSTVQFRLQLTLLDNASREVLAVHVLEVDAPAPSEDAAGGALAANAAVQQGLDQTAAFVHAALVALTRY